MRKAPICLFVCSLLLVILSSRMAVAGEAREGRPVRVVDFRGLVRLSPHYLRSKVKTRIGEPYSAEVISADVARLYALGEFDAERGIRVHASEDDRGVVVVFELSERSVVARIVVRGRYEISLGDLAEDLRSEKGKLLNRWLVRLDEDRIRARYVRDGYLFVGVSHFVRPSPGGRPGEVDLVFDIVEGRQVIIEQIVFSGVTAFEEEDLKAVMQTQEGVFFGKIVKGNLDREALERDLDNIAKWYRNHGYLDVRVEPGLPIFNDDRSRVDVVIHVREGDRYRVRSVTLRGVELFDVDELLSSLGIVEDAFFDRLSVESAIRKVARKYQQKSYILARPRLNITYDRQAHLLDLEIAVHEGGPVTIDRIMIQGNSKTRESVIRRELSIHPGESFDASLAEESRARLDRRRWFDSVTFGFRDGVEPGHRDVLLRVQEGKTGSILIGGGISSNVGFFGNLVYSQRNFDISRLPRSLDDVVEGNAFAGGGQNLSIQVQPGRDRSQYRVSFSEPYLAGYPVVLSTDFFVFDRDFGDYLESRVGGRLGFGYRLTKDIVALLNYRLESVRIKDIDDDAIPDVFEAEGTTLISSFQLALSIDQNLVDRTFTLIGGYAARISLEYGGGPFGGDLDFTKVEFRGNWQHTLFQLPFGYHWVVGVRTQVGWIEENRNTADIPIFERFFTGGSRTLRGFEFRSVGPQLNDEPRGGRFLGLASIEFSYPILPQGFVRGVAFVDAGSVVDRIDDFYLRDELETSGIRLSAGFGFRVFVPYFPAPVALDFGFPLIEMVDDDEQVFSFTVGIGF